MAYCHNNTAISDGQTKFFRAESFALFLKCSLGLNHRTEEELERKIKTKGRIESAWQEATADRESQTLVTDVLKESILALKQTKILIARLQSDLSNPTVKSAK
jgi:hypothetical protein